MLYQFKLGCTFRSIPSSAHLQVGVGRKGNLHEIWKVEGKPSPSSGCRGQKWLQIDGDGPSGSSHPYSPLLWICLFLPTADPIDRLGPLTPQDAF